MVLVGPPGVGKTYFCSAILENIPKGIRFLRGYSEKDLLRRVRQSFSGSGNGDYVTYLQSLIDDDLVIIDDIGASGYTEWRDEILFDTVDYRYSTKKPTILTTNLTMKELGETYSHRLKSRIFASENTVIDMSDCSDLRQEGL
jgi:DNA replication protein DnaC